MVVLYVIIAVLTGLNGFLLRKNLIEKKRFVEEQKLLTSQKIETEQQHTNKITDLLAQSNDAIRAAKEETTNVVREAGAHLQSAQNSIQERDDQIQQMFKHIDSLVETIDNLSETYEELKDYSFEVYERAVELNLFLINKLRGGFLEDNEEVREFVNQVRAFLQNSQDIQNRYGDLFLQEDDESQVDVEDEDIEMSMEEFFGEDDGEEEVFDEEESVEVVELFSEPTFKIKRSYESDKYE